MKGWSSARLGDSIKTNQFSIAKGYPYKKILYLDTGSITSGKIESFQELGLEAAPSRAKRIVQDNDIIYSAVRPIQRHYGFITNPPDNLIVSTGFVVITCDKKKIFPKYLYYYLTANSQVEELDMIAEASTSTYPSLRPEDIENLNIFFPQDVNEQKAIAAILSSLDDKIDLLHRQNKTLEATAETLFRQSFVEEAQEDWEETNLSDHTEVYRGLSYKGSGLSDVGDGLPMHNLNSIFEGGGYKESGIKYYSGEFKDRHIVKAGDIIVANTEQGHNFMLIGFPAVVPACFGESGLFSQHIYRLVPKSNSYLTVAFLYYLLMKPLVREQIVSATNGSTVNMLAIDGLQRPKFNLPPKEKIVEFTAMVDGCWKKKEINQLQIQTLEKLRDTLLPKLMSGEVRVAYETESNAEAEEAA